MDNAPLTPPSWGDQSVAASTASQPTVDQPTDDQSSDPSQIATEAFIKALETKCALWVQQNLGADALDEYLTMLEKDDLAAFLMFEAKHKINLEQMRFEQAEQIRQEMEAAQPGSSAVIFGESSEKSQQPDVRLRA